MCDLATRCRIACCLIALACTPCLGTAQAVDPLVAEGVQLRIDKLELARLLQTAQVDLPTWQMRNNALEQRNRTYTQKVRQLNREGQLALAQRSNNHFAVVFPPIQATWNADAARLRAEAQALSAKRSIELAADVPVAAQLQADRIILQRQQQKGEGAQDAEAKGADAATRIAAMQEKYTGYGPNWVGAFNQQMQQQAAEVVQARDVAERAADTTSEIGRDAKRATELTLAMERNNTRRATGAITYAEQRQADAPFKAELESIQAKFGAGGSLAASANDFNQRVTNAVNLGVRSKVREWELAGRAEAAHNRAGTQIGQALPTLDPAATAAAIKQQQELNAQAAARQARADLPIILAFVAAALAALAVYAFAGWLPRRTGDNGSNPSADSYKLGRYVIAIDKVTGQVLGTEKRSETHVTSSGGGGSSYQGTGHYTAPSIQSHVVTKHEFWLKLADGTQKSVQLSGHDIPLLGGQRVTLISVRLRERAYGSYVVLVNHTERAHRSLIGGRALFGLLGMHRTLTGAVGLVGLIAAFSLGVVNPAIMVVLVSAFLVVHGFRRRQKVTTIRRLDAEIERHAQLSYKTADRSPGVDVVDTAAVLLQPAVARTGSLSP